MVIGKLKITIFGVKGWPILEVAEKWGARLIAPFTTTASARNGRNGRNEVEEKEKERYKMIGIDRPFELESGLDHAVLKRYEMNGCWMSGWAVVNSLGVTYFLNIELFTATNFDINPIVLSWRRTDSEDVMSAR
ncbi:predicted protein [Sclerotinia sclerotiorum 1980 UF-70]|uniref:Uncharacterized protein n=1 Tax=Sclerotinia sclerotiorum (strain ATCC 18683 / 1980 / Ss-1) TaxID=665079 RepID=A7EMF0_SCLS1|nr:predicted protein [Sclerotinia sclerotiorum 1980 UF-70]EDO04016.1 predicted protein [Sclerotinia sclerotiorum 1980 UF-70]